MVDQPSTASPVARARAISASVVAAPALAGRIDSPSRIAPSRRSTRSTRSSRFGSHSRRTALVHLVVELARDLVGVEPCGEPDPRAVAAAVEIGGDDELLVRQWIAVGQPGAGAGAELELARAAPGGEPVGIGVQQHGAGAIDVDRRRVEPDAEPAGQVGRPVADAFDGAVVGLIVATATGEQPETQGEVGRQLVRATAQHVTLVEQRRHRAAEGARLGDQHRRQPGVHGEAEHPVTRRGGAPVLVDGAELDQQLLPGPQRLGRRRRS